MIEVMIKLQSFEAFGQLKLKFPSLGGQFYQSQWLLEISSLASISTRSSGPESTLIGALRPKPAYTPISIVIEGTLKFVLF